MDLKEEDVIGDQIDTHWYYTSKARMMADHLAALKPPRPINTIVDVGAGGGWFSRWTLREELAERAVCVDPGYRDERDEVEAGRPISFRRQLDEDLDPAECIPLVLMMDVLEHVEDDVGLLAQYLDSQRPGTPFFITVPAFQMLWSSHDVFLEHYRRYTLKSLKKTIEGAGAVPDRMHYFFGAIFPAVLAVRLTRRHRPATQSDMKPVPGVVNTLLKSVCAAEQRVMRYNRLAGVTAVALCHRPAD